VTLSEHVVQMRSMIRERDQELELLRRSLELSERFIDEVHRAAGCARDGLAGILGWVEEQHDNRRRLEHLRRAGQRITNYLNDDPVCYEFRRALS
jgi:hypothetical protein